MVKYEGKYKKRVKRMWGQENYQQCHSPKASFLSMVMTDLTLARVLFIMRGVQMAVCHAVHSETTDRSL